MKGASPAKIFTRWPTQVCVGLAVLTAVAWAWNFHQREVELHSRIYRIGFQNSYPFQQVTPEGNPGGLAYEVVNEAAHRAGIKLRWILQPPASPESQFRKDELDLWPLIADLPSRKAWISITKPWQAIGAWLAVKDSSPIVSADQMQGRTILYQTNTPSSLIAPEAFPQSTLIAEPDQEAVLHGVSNGIADGGLVWTTPDKKIRLYQESTGQTLKLRFLYIRNGDKPYGLGASYITPGAIRAARLLQQEIGNMAADGTVASLFFKSFLDPSNRVSSLYDVEELRTQRRYLIGATIGMAAILSLLGYQTLRVREARHQLRKSFDALRSSEYFYHSLIESLPQLIARKDAKGIYTYANSAFCDFVARPLDQVTGKSDGDLFPLELAAKTQEDDAKILRLRQPLEYEQIVEREGSKRYLQIKKVPLYDDQNQPIGVQVFYWDGSTFREIEEKLKEAQREVVEISRLAGIAEVATGVLHNIGNALNSVTTSASIASSTIFKLNLDGIQKTAQLLSDPSQPIAALIARDERAQKIPGYLSRLFVQLKTQRDEAVQELSALLVGTEHIAEIVSAQQSHARVCGVVEKVSPNELVEYALRINEASLSRHGITVVREYMPTPAINVERQKAVQIIGNLIRNAKDSITESGKEDKRLTVSLSPSPTGRVLFSIADNGVGIEPENTNRIFNFGFTTKKSGHGFGLHSSALAANQMGGSLHVQSEGKGKGATFILELPAAAVAVTENRTQAETTLKA